MDINDLRSIITLLSFACFISIVVWAYSGKRKQAFDEAASLAVGDDDEVSRGGKAGQQ